MAHREMVETKIFEAFVVRNQKFNDQSYPYFTDSTAWKTPELAFEAFGQRLNPRDGDIIVRRIYSWTDIGRVTTHDTTIYKNGVWEGYYDPRRKDPEWATYLRLKEKFDEGTSV